MLRPDFWWWSAARAEIDHRAREARLGLEHLERLLVSRVAPTRSARKQVPDGQVLRFFRGGCVQDGQTTMAPPGRRRGQARHFPTEVCIAASIVPVAVKTAIGEIARGAGAA
jgi:hypothetical protein